MNNYELMVVFTPVLSDDEFKAELKKFAKLVTDAGGSIVAENPWGLKSLAYPIQKKTTGFYQLFEFSGEGEAIINNLEVAYKRDERVLRFLTIALDKHAAAWADKRKGKFSEAKTKKREGANA